MFFENLWNAIRNFFIENWVQITVFAAVLVFGYIAIKIAVWIFGRMFRRTKLNNNAAGSFLLSVIKVFLYVIYLIALLALLGVPVTSMIAVLSAFALAVSLALQGTFSNFASGIVIISTKPFGEGDFVDIGGQAGTVKSVTIFNTHLVTPDNKAITLPNSTVVNADVINYSAYPTRRLDLTVSAAYGSDIEKVKAVIGGVLQKHEEILKDPAPTVRLAEHGASSLDFAVRVWVSGADYWNVNFALKEELYDAFNENEISIPFNQLDVHVIKD